MPGELANYGEMLALDAVFNDFDLFLGLATSPIEDDDDIGDIDEVEDANYERKLVSFSIPDQEGGKGTIRNLNMLQFGPWDENQPTPVSYAFITNEELIGEGGELVAYTELPSYKMPEVDELIVLLEDDLVIQID